MAVKPTDLRVLIPKTQELSRTEQIREKQYQNDQQFYAAQQQQQTERELRQVQLSPEAYRAMIRAKEERERQKARKKAKSTKNAEAAGKTTEDDENKNYNAPKQADQYKHIDIRL